MDGEAPDWVALRAAHLDMEAHLRLLGTLVAGVSLMGAITAASVLGSAALGGVIDTVAVPFSLPLGEAAARLLLGLGGLWTGRGLRRLDERARRPAALLFGVAVLAGPLILKLLAGSGLYILFSAKGKTLFSPEYAEARARTPDMVVKTSIWGWGCLALALLAALGLGLYLSALR